MKESVKKLRLVKLVGKITTTCFECNNDTNHGVIAKYRRLKPDRRSKLKVDQLSSYQDFMIVQCAGCNNVSFLDRTYDKVGGTWDYQYPESEYYEFEDLFLPDEEFDKLPKLIRDLYQEVKDAFETKSKILTGIGLRTLVEAVCLHQAITGNTLQDKIQNLNKGGFVSNSEVPILHKLRTIGNVSAHEVKGIPLSILKHAVAVINHLVRSVYLLPKVNKKIKL